MHRVNGAHRAIIPAQGPYVFFRLRSNAVEKPWLRSTAATLLPSRAGGTV